MRKCFIPILILHINIFVRSFAKVVNKLKDTDLAIVLTLINETYRFKITFIGCYI